MPVTEVQNDYLLELLALQQDGRRAISAPSNWATQRPLLEVETEVDNIVDELQKAILKRNRENRSARWHFFIGSPGNGKSAAMGKLCEGLLSGYGCRVSDENGVAINDLDKTTVPYAINVYEGNNNYASAQIVQDASVVRNPFSQNVDPARDLMHTLEENWKKGRSLIVCTNRGVLEKAHRDNHMNSSINTSPWFKILSGLVSANTSLFCELQGQRDFDNNRTVFEKVVISYSHLDNRSLLLGRDIFDQLLQKATDQDHWSICESCSSKKMCPFNANRDWLAELQPRKQVLQLLRRAEILSGQVIVFREALALISLILAGCPRDYQDIHPCEWVKSRADSADIFSLVVRRIYMCLFGSYYPYGLEASDYLRNKQLEALKIMYGVFEDENSNAKAAIFHVIHNMPPSTDVGVTRLLGSSGVIASLDPLGEALPTEFYENWDLDSEEIQQGNAIGFGAIEEACVYIWKSLEDKIEFAAEHWAPDAHWAIRRWCSNFFLHLGALVQGHSAWAAELDKFAELLELVNRPPTDRTLDQKLKIRDLDKRLEELLDSIAGKAFAGTVQLSDMVTLQGDWFRSELKPKTVANEESGSMSLAINFFGEERAILGAHMYLWLTRRAEGKLDRRCFPLELLVGATDARVRAAAKGRYAFVSDDVELIIKTDRSDFYKIMRIDSEVDVKIE